MLVKKEVEIHYTIDQATIFTLIDISWIHFTLQTTYN